LPKQDRDALRALAEKHGKELIAHELEYISAPKNKAGKRGGPSTSPNSAIPLWLAVELKRAPELRNGKQLSVSRASEFVYAGISKPYPDWKITSDHIRKVHRHVESRRSADPQFAAVTSECRSTLIARLQQTNCRFLPTPMQRTPKIETAPGIAFGYTLLPGN
jgi:hypothetical protein